MLTFTNNGTAQQPTRDYHRNEICNRNVNMVNMFVICKLYEKSF